MAGSPEPPRTPRDDTETTHAATKSFTKSKDEFTVLVTGFGHFPYGSSGSGKVNTSHLVTKHLPAYLSTSNSLNPTNLPIRILNPMSGDGKYVRTEYAYVRKFIKDMWDEYEDKVDAVIHTGMAGPWYIYSVEERAFGEGMTSTWWSPREEKEGYYMRPDDEGKTVKDIGEGRERPWEDMPLGLAPRVSAPKLIADAMRVVNLREEGKEKVQVRVWPHFEAGQYLCGFLFYESLATVRKRGLDTKVLFCHVPGWEGREQLKRGADAICAVIGAVCKQIQDGL